MAAELKVLPRSPDARDVEANEVHKQFAVESEVMTTETERMAGFVIVTWDDEGYMHSSLHVGEMSPLPMAMIPHLVKDYLKAHIIK